MRNILTPFLLTLTLFAQAQSDGILDNSWGSMGRVTATPSGGGTYNLSVTSRQKMVILSNKKILVSFTTQDGDKDFGLARFNEDGSFDGTFGTNGVLTIELGGDDEVTGLALQSDGKVILGGYSIDGGSGASQFALARVTTSGTLDASFGTAGITRTTINLDAGAYALAVRPNDKIILAGYSSIDPGEFSFAVAQYTAAGILDAANFGSGLGYVVTDVNGFDQFNDVAIQTDGKIVGAGYTVSGGDREFALLRYNANGTLDNTPGSFGTNGIAITSFSAANDDEAFDLAYHPTSGKFVAAGNVYNGVTYDFAFAVYFGNGTLDPGYGSGTGRVTSDFGDNETAYAVEIQGNNKIVLAGSQYTTTMLPPPLDNDFITARYNAGGGLDGTYGTGGSTVVDFGGNDRGLSMAFGIGYVMLGGVTDFTGSAIALARLANVGAPLPANLSPLTVSRQGNAALLQWATFSEQDLSRFEILRSTDGRSFSTLGSLSAAGNSSSTRNYSFTDAQPNSGTNFYRLRIVNANGSVGLGNIVALRFGSRTAVSVFPNPVRGNLNLQLTQPAGPVQIRIADATGRVLHSSQLRSSGSTLSTSIDMSRWKAGVYFVQVNEETVSIVKE